MLHHPLVAAVDSIGCCTTLWWQRSIRLDAAPPFGGSGRFDWLLHHPLVAAVDSIGCCTTLWWQRSIRLDAAFKPSVPTW
jgi:hypothetical protein